MDKRFWGIIGVIGVIFVGVLLFNGGDKAGAPSADKATNHVMGANNKDILLVEYGDYQCPYCGQSYPILKQIVEKYGGDIAFQFRNLPLAGRHKNAVAAARAAEAADKQGKFWEMHDLLYENQPSWEGANDVLAIFETYAKQLSLNVTQFREDFASSGVNDRINADIAAFKKTGAAMSTPSFFINGKHVEINNTLESFTSAIDAEIAKKTGSPADL